MLKKIILGLALAGLSIAAHAETQRARYGVAETFNFVLFNADGTLDVDEVDSGTEVSLSCDEGAETTATNDFADEGTFYSIALSAAELKCERVAVVIAATTTNVFHIQASALDNGVIAFGTAQSATGTTIVLAAATSFADDFLNCATIAITGGTGAGQARSFTDWVSATDTGTVATWLTNPDNTSVYEVYQTACATGSVTIATGGIVPGSFASGAIDSAAIAPDAIGSSEIAANAITDAEVASDVTIASVTGAVGSVTGSVSGNVTGSVGSIGAGGITANSIGTDAFTASKFAADVTTEITTGIPAAIRDLLVDDQGGGIGLGCAIAALTAFAAGDISTTSGTTTWRDPSNTEVRISSTVTSAGNRTATITCPTY